MTDFNRMIDEGFVVDGDGERSPIIFGMQRGASTWLAPASAKMGGPERGPERD